jgi:sortase A
VLHGPHFETKTHDANLLGIKKRSALGALLVTVPTVVIISLLVSFELAAYPAEAHTRFVATHQPTSELKHLGESARGSSPQSESQVRQQLGLPTNGGGYAAGLDQATAKGSSAGNTRAAPSREKAEDRVAALRKGELLLSVPRLGLRDVRVPSGSTQAELDGEGIIRLETSGLPSLEGSNTFIVGHRMGFPRTRNPYVFYELNKLRPRDEILVEDPAGSRYVFEVYDHITGPPGLYWLTDPVVGKTVISLQTCTPIPSFEDRLVVRGELISVTSKVMRSV